MLSYYAKVDNSPVESVQEVQLKTEARRTASLQSQCKVHILFSS